MYINETEVAEMLGLSKTTLRNYRALKKGPPYCKIEGTVRYEKENIEAYLLEYKVGKLSDAHTMLNKFVEDLVKNLRETFDINIKELSGFIGTEANRERVIRASELSGICVTIRNVLYHIRSMNPISSISFRAHRRRATLFERLGDKIVQTVHIMTKELEDITGELNTNEPRPSSNKMH